jgi:Inner membrane protein YgaP-like, transmembrane domain
MNLDRAVISFAGVMVLISVALAYAFSPYWLLLTVFVGLNLLQSGFTGFCPAALVFKRIGIRAGNAFR